jgi:hypothetical protein
MNALLLLQLDIVQLEGLHFGFQLSPTLFDSDMAELTLQFLLHCEVDEEDVSLAGHFKLTLEFRILLESQFLQKQIQFYVQVVQTER